MWFVIVFGLLGAQAPVMIPAESAVECVILASNIRIAQAEGSQVKSVCFQAIEDR